MIGAVEYEATCGGEVFQLDVINVNNSWMENDFGNCSPDSEGHLEFRQKIFRNP